MSQRIVEIVIGRLVTDELFRARFVADGEAVLRELCDQGLALSRTELSALLETPVALWLDAADRIDPRLQKASFENALALPETTTRSSTAAS